MEGMEVNTDVFSSENSNEIPEAKGTVEEQEQLERKTKVSSHENFKETTETRNSIEDLNTGNDSTQREDEKENRFDGDKDSSNEPAVNEIDSDETEKGEAEDKSDIFKNTREKVENLDRKLSEEIAKLSKDEVGNDYADKDKLEEKIEREEAESRGKNDSDETREKIENTEAKRNSETVEEADKVKTDINYSLEEEKRESDENVQRELVKNKSTEENLSEELELIKDKNSNENEELSKIEVKMKPFTNEEAVDEMNEETRDEMNEETRDEINEETRDEINEETRDEINEETRDEKLNVLLDEKSSSKEQTSQTIDVEEDDMKTLVEEEDTSKKRNLETNDSEENQAILKDAEGLNSQESKETGRDYLDSRRTSEEKRRRSPPTRSSLEELEAKVSREEQEARRSREGSFEREQKARSQSESKAEETIPNSKLSGEVREKEVRKSRVSSAEEHVSSIESKSRELVVDAVDSPKLSVENSKEDRIRTSDNLIKSSEPSMHNEGNALSTEDNSHKAERRSEEHGLTEENFSGSVDTIVGLF